LVGGSVNTNFEELRLKHVSSRDMKRHSPREARRNELPEPSALVRRFAPKIAAGAGTSPILDVGCGTSRNAMVLSQLGCSVICMDKDLTAMHAQRLRLRDARFHSALVRLIPLEIDFLRSGWPIAPRCVGGIVNIHFFLPILFPFFVSSLVPGGYFVFETVPGYGGNFLELPKAGQIRSMLEHNFAFDLYKETKAGPSNCNAVTVRLVAKRTVET
jgi:SAM-dependent methyltransferase